MTLNALLLVVAITFGVAAMVLLAGTEMLGFYWIGVAAAAGLGLGFYLVRKRTPAEYTVAQTMDDRLHLEDTLSTAAYFSETAATASTDPTIRAVQQRRAEQVAETVNLPHALPLARPAMLIPAAVLALIALGVFLFRFAVTGSFDPRVSLIKGVLDSFSSTSAENAKNPKQMGTSEQSDEGEPDDRETEQNSDFAGDPESEPQQEVFESQIPQPADQKGDEPQDQKSDAQGSPDGEKQEFKDQNKEGNLQSKNQNSDQEQDPSMLDKVKQALSEMLNKMKPQAGDSKGAKQKSESSQAKQQKSESPDDTQSDSPQDASESQNAQNGQEDSDKSSNKQSKDSQSGAGTNEGDKAQRMAEALKAMGKISELMGKRAENVTGSVMVEVGSTKQQMKTQVTQSAARHAEAGGEIHRDEVAPMYEHFVQQYFEQIRKSPPPAADAPPEKPAR